MTDRARTKALFRTKLRESEKQKEKQINSPFIRYNEQDQPVCKVCNIALKSESAWPAHQVSRKHHEAIESFRASVGVARGGNINVEPPVEINKARPSSTLPTDFFDDPGTKRLKNDMGPGGKIQSGGKTSPSLDGPFKVPQHVMKTNEHARVSTGANVTSENTSSTMLRSLKKSNGAGPKQARGALPENFFDSDDSDRQSPNQPNDAPININDSEAKQAMRAPSSIFSNRSGTIGSDQDRQSKAPDTSETKQVTGALPEGFFDNKDADLRARGIQPVKVDINEEIKEFEKDIQADLQEVDDRMGEEEIDAADVREEFESLEQREFREQVEMMKKNLKEAKAARLAKEQKAPAFMGKESSDDSSSDEDDDDDNYAVDWRAKHL